MKIRVTGRFYLVLVLIVLLFVFLFRDSLFATSEVTSLYAGSASDVRKVRCVIVRDEVAVARGTQVDMIDYIAEECAPVSQGDVVCNVYTSAYASKLKGDLDDTRKKVQAYHKIVLGNELDSTLNELNLGVQQRALELKTLISGDARGNLLGAVDNLETAMEERRTYMRSSQMSDGNLVKYYDSETQNQNAISSWQTPKTATADGIVSFYTDGYETELNAETIGDIGISDVRAVLAGERLSDETRGKKDETIFRIVNQNHWYIVLMSDDSDWNPTLDTKYSFVVDGYDELAYEGTVIRVPKEGTTVMAVLEVNQPIGSLIYLRSGSASIGADMNGYIVSKAAIDTQSGQKGVWKYDVPGGTFVAVEVLADRGDGYVLIMPLTDGVLTSGDQLLIK
ncbi:MAG: hypothetical protein IJM56_06290 [Clostridia bacterium]|nr:hypothetical protein [Clostridia bacterium]